MGRTAGTKDKSLEKQIKDHIKSKPKKQKSGGKYGGNKDKIISTGSTLLDLAISGGKVRGGGIFAGIMIEIFGPEATGKTVMLSEIAGYIQRQGGSVLFQDPEARLDKEFAGLFDFSLDKAEYAQPDIITEVFKNIRTWKPKDETKINAICTDSLAALSTKMEMTKEEGDKMGGRRGKEFSEGFRKTCRLLKKKDYLLVCSNQLRDTMAAFGPKTKSTGGYAIGYYSSVRLGIKKPMKGFEIRDKKTFKGVEVERTKGISVEVKVVKNSTWKPFRIAPVSIIFDYGVDDIRENLKFIKKYSKYTTYTINKISMGKGINDAIAKVEKNNLEDELKEQVIDLWEEIEDKFKIERKKKKR